MPLVLEEDVLDAIITGIGEKFHWLGWRFFNTSLRPRFPFGLVLKRESIPVTLRFGSVDGERCETLSSSHETKLSRHCSAARVSLFRCSQRCGAVDT